MTRILNFIGGEFVPPASGEYFENIAPAEGRVCGEVPDSDNRDVQRAVVAATSAFSKWSMMPIGERSRVLIRLADLVEANLEKLAQAESKDTGKPISLARTLDIPRAAANLRFFASAIVNQSTEAHIVEGEAVNYTRRSAIGVVGCISPWNLPLYLFTWKIAPALAIGNCVIAKPSELTPMTAFILAELAQESGVIPGALNILHGYGSKVGQAIVDHPKVKAISFTGGTKTGQIIGQAAARQFKEVSLELGGKNPTIIFEDCNFDETITNVIRSSFLNQGEICLCGSRILVETSIYERFKEEFIARVNKLKKGNPSDPETEFGSLISAAHFEKVLKFIREAKEEGGRILTGGDSYSVPGLNGYFVQPTVIEGLGPDCRINQDEIFGPVVTLQQFEMEDEAIELANASDYGLACSIWTSDVKRAHRVAHRIKCGIVWINCWMLRDLRTPFGGMKNSGLGREGGDEALRFFSETQNICIKT